MCDELEPIVNGMITYNMESPYVGTVATYSCNTGNEFSTTGDEMRTCEEASDGSGAIFGGTAPTCEREFLSNIISKLSSYSPPLFTQLSVMHWMPLLME